MVLQETVSVLQNQANATGSQNYHAPAWAALTTSRSCMPSRKHAKKAAASLHTLQTPNLLPHSPPNKLFPKHLHHTLAPGFGLLPLLTSLLTRQRCRMPTLPLPRAHLAPCPSRTAEPRARRCSTQQQITVDEQ